MSTADLLRRDGDEINVPRDLTTEQCAELLAAGLIVETGDEAARPDRRYQATDYARDVIFARL